MCLIVFAWQVMPDVPLVAASNRDEFYARPALPAHRWEDHPEIYAGRDLEGGGTWLGVADRPGQTGRKGSRFAALTNGPDATPDERRCADTRIACQRLSGLFPFTGRIHPGHQTRSASL